MDRGELANIEILLGGARELVRDAENVAERAGDDKTYKEITELAAHLLRVHEEVRRELGYPEERPPIIPLTLTRSRK